MYIKLKHFYTSFLSLTLTGTEFQRLLRQYWDFWAIYLKFHPALIRESATYFMKRKSLLLCVCPLASKIHTHTHTHTHTLLFPFLQPLPFLASHFQLKRDKRSTWRKTTSKSSAFFYNPNIEKSIWDKLDLLHKHPLTQFCLVLWKMWYTILSVHSCKFHLTILVTPHIQTIST